MCLNLLIFFGVHANTSASSKFLSQKCMCAFVVGGEGPLRLCEKHSMSHNLSIYTSIGSMLNRLELVFLPQD